MIFWLAIIPPILFLLAVVAAWIVDDKVKFNRSTVQQTPEERQAMQMALAELAEIEWQEGIGPEPAHLKYERERKQKEVLVLAMKQKKYGLYADMPKISEATFVSYDEHGVPT